MSVSTTLTKCLFVLNVQFFTWGSVIWVINGFASFLPYGDSAHYGPAPYCAGWTGFIGATVFEFGSILGMWEAWNREDVAGFGWGVKQVFRGTKKEASLTTDNVVNDLEAQLHVPSSSSNDTRTLASQEKTKEFGDSSEASSLTFTGTLPPHLHKKWIWFSLDTKYFHEIGFLAAFFQFWAATIFWISG